MHVQAMGLELDGTGFGLGQRSQRYAAVIEDGVVSVTRLCALGVENTWAASPRGLAAI
jgi:peroxiredoxin